MPAPKTVLNTFQSNATYQIIVEGNVEHLLRELLPGAFKVSYSESGGKKISTLIGQVEDQAQLTGVLNMIYNSRMTVISVLKI